MKPTPYATSSSWLLGNTNEFRQDPVAFFRSLESLEKPLAGFRLAVLDCCYLASAGAVKYALQMNMPNFIKGGVFYTTAQAIVGDGLVFLNGEHWKERRVVLNPLFYKESIERYFNLMLAETQNHIEKWKKQGQTPVDVVHDMHQLTFMIGAKTLFGEGLSIEQIQTLIAQMNFMLAEIKQRTESGLPIPLWLPTPANRRLQRVMNEFDALVEHLIDYQSEKKDTLTLISLLQRIEHADTGKPLLNMKQIEEEIKVFFVAGTDTSAHALAWAIYLLALHPEVRQNIAAEVNRIAGAEQLSLGHLQQLDYTEQVLSEVLRLYPPAWLISRSTLREDAIDGYRVKKNSNIFISPYMLHHSSKYWQDPEVFNPERFSEENIAKINKDAYIPFGTGGRKCIGYRFALMEMKMILALLVKHFSWELIDGDKVEKEFSSTLKPKNLTIQLKSFSGNAS